MSQFVDYLNAQLGSIYLWGGQGEDILAQDNPLAYIRSKETSEANAQRVYKLFLKRKAEGCNPILAYDCSGLIVNFLLNVGILKSDRTAAALYAMCDEKLDKPEQIGDFCCYYHPEKKYITHIGVFVGDGKIIEAYGRDVGVIKTDVKSRPFNRFGRLNALTPYLVDEPLSLDVVKPCHSGDAYAAMQTALNQLGYGELVVDGKWGKKSREAWDRCVDANHNPIDLILKIGDCVVYENKI